MLNNFIYAKTKDLFIEQLEANQILDEAIVFIEDTKEIWNHGTYFAGISDSGLDQETIDQINAEIKNVRNSIPTTTSQLTNDSGFLTEHQDISGKVDKVDGKGLSTNDYTDEDKSKLEGLNNYDDSEVKQSIVEIRESIANINPAPMVSVTYSELVELRNNGELISGMQYRITDYVTTTAQENTQSAGHQFDVIVTADDANTLNEVARVALHEGDTYFADSDLNAWQIWYSFDNDTSRFAWADVENGKGVIYRMIDEFGNDCPYDFKNIQFKHPHDTVTYPGYYYTFSVITSGIIQDQSVTSSMVYDNSIKPFKTTFLFNTGSGVIVNSLITLNCVVLIGNSTTGPSDNIFEDVEKISFGANSANTFKHCNDISFGNYCNGNFFDSCSSLHFKDNTDKPLDYCQANRFHQCKYVNVLCENAPNWSKSLQLINAAAIWSGDININPLGQNYEIKISKNSKGEIKVYCEADLIA